jgi:hypothetical protein
MPPENEPSPDLPDTVIAGSLVAAPAWGPLLSQVNQLLTTATLIVGLILGCGRLWLFLRDRRKRLRRDA